MIAFFKKTFLLYLSLTLIYPTAIVHGSPFKPVDKLTKSKILVYTKNGKGYVHDNIAASVKCIQELGIENKFSVEVSDDPTIFNEENLKKYSLLIFTSTNNDVFDNDQQRLAFRRYIEAGGGFVGLHSVTGTERNWTWFKMLIGETFSWHAKFQSFSVINIDPSHPSMKDVPKVWTKEDECYFGKELYPGIHVLMMHDLSTLHQEQNDLISKNAGSYANFFPAVWCQDFQGGHVWITTLGHDKNNYENPIFKNHILQGIKYVANQFNGLHYENAFANDRNDPLKLK
jgi:type 1 glutamine amidotransferase